MLAAWSARRCQNIREPAASPARASGVIRADPIRALACIYLFFSGCSNGRLVGAANYPWRRCCRKRAGQRTAVIGKLIPVEFSERSYLFRFSGPSLRLALSLETMNGEPCARNESRTDALIASST